jgi:hypothetical protein
MPTVLPALIMSVALIIMMVVGSVVDNDADHGG